MDHIKRKTIFTFLYILAAGLVGLAVIMMLYIGIEVDADYDVFTQKLQTLTVSYEDMVLDFFDAEDSLKDDLSIPARLTVSGIRADGSELEPGRYENGFIVQLTGDGSGRPDGLPDMDMTDDEIRAEFTDDEHALIWQSSLEGWIAAVKIRDDLYYMEFIPMDEQAEGFIGSVDIFGSLNALSKSTSFDYVLVSDYADDLDSEMPVIAATGEFRKDETLKDVGFRGKIRDEKASEEYGVVVRNKHLYLARPFTPEGTNSTYHALMLINLRSVMYRAFEQSGVQLFITLLIWITLCIWILSIIRLIRDKRLTQKELSHYSPRSVWHKVALYLTAGAIAVCLCAAFNGSLESMFLNTTYASSTLEGFFDRMDVAQEEVSVQQKVYNQKYERESRRIASLLNKYPELLNSSWLQEAADITGADYIMIYNADGREMISNSHYRGLALGTDESSATYDFRRLLRGVDFISHSNVTDEVTGLTRDLHGTSLRFNSTDNAYGAMIIAVDPETLNITESVDEDEIAASITGAHELCLGIDPETEEIAVTSNKDYAGMDIKSIGLSSLPLTSTFMGTMNVDGTEYYGVASQYHNDSLIYYFAKEKSFISDTAWPFALNSTLVYIVMSAFLALILLSGFNQKNIDNHSASDTEGAEEKGPADDEGTESKKSSNASWWSMFSLFDSNAAPARKAFSAAQIMLLAFVLFIAFSLFRARATSAADDSVIDFIAHRRWESGFNFFAIAAVLYTFCALIAILVVLKLLSMLFAEFMNERTATVWLLIINTLNYTVLVAFVFIALSFLGVNTRAIFASVSLAGLALTLGAQGFIADILAGITTVTDGTYQVGDTVEIGGFRGEVSRLGMRSTTVIGKGKSVRTIRNSTIGDVTNFSRMNSWYGLTLTISSAVPLDSLETILREELPEVGQKYSKIISGPEYRGVESINGDKTTILILTECKQDDYSSVSRTVNREVLRILRNHDIKML
ncbi:MAG: mechanosensitive ion channel family protein [Mogibacterium sp.]|nr:mechanosensitive ion channel family protein [Mogibacterium sp.]